MSNMKSLWKKNLEENVKNLLPNATEIDIAKALLLYPAIKEALFWPSDLGFAEDYISDNGLDPFIKFKIK